MIWNLTSIGCVTVVICADRQNSVQDVVRRRLCPQLFLCSTNWIETVKFFPCSPNTSLQCAEAHSQMQKQATCFSSSKVPSLTSWLQRNVHWYGIFPPQASGYAQQLIDLQTGRSTETLVDVLSRHSLWQQCCLHNLTYQESHPRRTREGCLSSFSHVRSCRGGPIRPGCRVSQLQSKPV